MRVSCLFLVLTSCTYTLSDDALDVALVGRAPAFGQPIALVESSHYEWTGNSSRIIRLGNEQVLVWGEESFGGLYKATLISLVSGQIRELSRGERGNFAIADRAIFVYGGQHTHVQVIESTDLLSGREFDFPDGCDVVAGKSGNVFYCQLMDSNTIPQLHLVSLDPPFERSVTGYFSAPKIDDSERYLSALDSPVSQTIFSFTGGADYYLDSSASVDLDGQSRTLFLCGVGTGLVFSSFDQTRRQILDNDCYYLCDSSPDWLLYLSSSAVKRVARDGAAEPSIVAGYNTTHYLGGVWPGCLCCTTPVAQPVYDAVEGWLGDWRFMTRGRSPAFSRDFSRLRWLEYAATSNRSGQLRSAAIGGEPLRLAYNVTKFEELEDGRVLALANAPFAGQQNRLIAIDEQHRTAVAVAEDVQDYLRIPDSNDVLVWHEIVNGKYELYRVAIPPPTK